MFRCNICGFTININSTRNLSILYDMQFEHMLMHALDPYVMCVCPICNLNIPVAEINDHVLSTHITYSQLSMLDHKNEDNGFCGFSVMRDIELINYAYDKNDDCCTICCEKYQSYIPPVMKEDCHALLLLCCKQYICHKCLEAHCRKSETYSCPYCRMTFNKKEQDYIEELDVTRWLPWIMRNRPYQLDTY